MNIFKVLSQGKSRLNEPSISAMLGYLLSSNEDHGLGDTFLRDFVKMIGDVLTKQDIFKEILGREFIKSDVELEVQYVSQKESEIQPNIKNKRNDIDIQISFYDENEENEIHRIIIENKIKKGAANSEQLKRYYEAITNEEDFRLQKPQLTFVFLTPKVDGEGFSLEYNELKKIIKAEHNSVWINWQNNEKKEISVLHIVKNILKKEIEAEINPINEYMRHTLKAFVKHVSIVVTPEIEKRRTNRVGEDIGNIIEEMEIETSDKVKHRIIRRDSSQIQVYNSETEEKEIARYVMAKYIDENNIQIKHAELNTRMIGKKLLDELRSGK